MTSRGQAAVKTGIFRGFSPDAFAFLAKISECQDRTWFQANKARYETVLRAPMMDLVADLSAVLLAQSIPMYGEPKRAVFRINRDIRFSRDKRPYKTHIGAALTQNGRKMSPGVLYIQIAPAGSFVAAGFFRPAPEILDQLRLRIADEPAKFRAVLNKLRKAGVQIEPDDNALKRIPRGYEAITDANIAEALRRKSHILQRPISQSEALSAHLTRTLADFAKTALPLLSFGWDAM